MATRSDGTYRDGEPAPATQQAEDGRIRTEAVHVVAAFLCAVACGTATNYLIKFVPTTTPVALNGWRTLVAFLVVLFPALWFIPRRDLKLNRQEIGWYVILAAMTMAVPHALIFQGLQVWNANVAAVAFIEAAVLGVVVVYLFTGGERVNVRAVICSILAVVGLALFLNLKPNALQLAVGDALILGAAVATGIGLIAAEKLEPPAVDKSLPGKLRRSLKKTTYCCLLSGAGTLLTIAVLNLTAGGTGIPVPPVDAWPWVLVLALVGNCLTWFSMFLLIALGQLLLAAAVLPAIAAATVAVDYIWFPNAGMAPLQAIGGAVVLVSLTVLFWLQLAPAASASRPSAKTEDGYESSESE